MKSFIAISTLLFAVQSHAVCHDVSGTFRGICKETFKDASLNKNPELQFTITQNACDSVTIQTKSFPSGFSMTDQYDLKGGLKEIGRGPDNKVIAGGAFGQNGFSGVTLYMKNDGTGPVVSILNEYEKVRGSDGSVRLTVKQVARGYQLDCDVPVAE